MLETRQVARKVFHLESSKRGDVTSMENWVASNVKSQMV